MSSTTERPGITYVEVGPAGKNDEHRFLLTPVDGGLGASLDADVIVSEVFDLEGGQVGGPIGVYSFGNDVEQQSVCGPIRYTLRPIPEELIDEASNFVRRSQSRGVTLEREENPQAET